MVTCQQLKELIDKIKKYVVTHTIKTKEITAVMKAHGIAFSDMYPALYSSTNFTLKPLLKLTITLKTSKKQFLCR